MLEHFKQLSYPDKLSYFHAHFGIIPFPFPDFNTEISWYNNKSQLALLIENLYMEVPKKNICEKSFLEDECLIIFNAQPISATQRIQYNRFIISSFLEINSSFRKKIDSDLQTANNPIEFLTSQINALTSMLEWMKSTIYKLKMKMNLPTRFLQILFSGLNFCYTDKQIIIQQRRKFVELYLFSQGIFFADYLSTLEALLEEKKVALALCK